MEGALGGDPIEYWFGLGDGAVTTWHSPASQGAVLLDFDGDGRLDDAMLDLDGDGRADVAALDLDDDGRTESYFRDDGAGIWGIPVTESGAPRTDSGSDTSESVVRRCPAPAAPAESAPPPAAAAAPADSSPVTPVPAEPGQPPRQAVVDTDGDGTPDVLIFDADGDETADGALHLAR